MKINGKKKLLKKIPRKTNKPLRKNKSLIKTIQNVINKKAEDKSAFESVIDRNFNSGINQQTDVQHLIPNINIGTGPNSRVGAQISPKSLTIMGHIHSNLTNNTYSDCRLGVRMMIVSPKGYVGYEPAYNSAVTWLAQLLRRGATTVAFTGSVLDYYSEINTDVVTCHYDRKFYIRSPYVPSTNSGDNSTVGSIRFFKIRLPVKSKTFKYDSAVNSGLSPTNYNPFLILGYCHLDNATPDTVQTQINLNFSTTLKFQDL